MMKNYRSTPQILAAANSLIDKNQYRIKKDLIPTLAPGAPVRCHLADTQEEEAKWMVEQLRSLHEGGVPWQDMAVLYRAHYVSRAVEEAFLGAQIPYAIYSGVQFYGRMEIRDAIAYLRMLVYRDDLSFLRVANVPKRNLGKRRMAALRDYAAAHDCTLYQALLDNLEEELFQGTKARQLVNLVESLSAQAEGRPVSEVLTAVLQQSGYERMLRTEGSQERLDNLAELKQAIYTYETTCGEEVTLEHYLAHVALLANSDTGERGDKVRMMTIHAAKGLEFPHVFLCGMNEGIFPSRKVRTRQAMEEERRLAFVALTRAEQGLSLSAAGGRNFDGAPRYPSRFLLDIDPALLDCTGEFSEGLIREARAAIESSQRDLLAQETLATLVPGQRVRHAVFGLGTVLDVDLEKAAHVIQFDELSTSRSISFKARLEPC